MSRSTVPARATVLDRAIRRIARRERPNRSVVTVVREPLDLASSWALERVQIVLDDGSFLEVLFKDLGRDARGSGAGTTKPAEVIDARREGWVYRHVLSGLDVGAPRLLGIAPYGPGRAFGLFLEAIEGTRLAETGFGRPWEDAARLLARLHARAASRARSGSGTAAGDEEEGPLLRHGPELHRRWLARALVFSGDADRRRRILVASMAPAHERAIRLAGEGPEGFLHGEFYPSNVLVERDTDAVRPVDWEMAGWGPVLLDLAALTAGLGAGERALLLDAYAREARTEELDLPPGRAFEQTFVACRLLLAIQWLGWAAAWTPPREHRFDWTQEALRCAHELMR